jgi:uncharacterized protein (DUF1778 family)
MFNTFSSVLTGAAALTGAWGASSFLPHAAKAKAHKAVSKKRLFMIVKAP